MTKHLKALWLKRLVTSGDILFSAFILATIIPLFLYTGRKIYELFLSDLTHGGGETAHNIVYIIVLLKVYKILVHYFQYHHLNIKYLVQISIIAPAIEVIFAPEAQDIWTNVLFAVYSFVNLIVYVRYRKELDEVGH